MEIVILAVIAFLALKFGIIRIVISWIKKSDAAASIQTILEKQKGFLLFNGDPATTASTYVQEAWESKPDVFNGKCGGRPHKLSVIIYSLALAAQKLDKEKNLNFSSAMVGLGEAISELEVNSGYYPLSDLDKSLIDEAMLIIRPFINRQSLIPNVTKTK